MGDMRGADLEAMANLAKQFDRSADRLRRTTRIASAGVNSLAQVWDGPDAQQFRQLWQTTHRAKLLQAATELQTAAATVERNRQAQEATSSADSVPATGAAPTTSRAAGAMSWLGVPDVSIDFDLPDLPDVSLSFPDVNIGIPNFPNVPNFGVPGVVVDATVESASRLNEFGDYLGDANKRRVAQDGRFWFLDPGAPIDVAFEDGSAGIAILGMGGELYKGDADGYCDGSQSCIVGVSTPLGGAITLGHTVLYSTNIPDEELVAHEQQHVYQYEEHGTLGFLANWGVSSVVDIALGGDGYYDTEHEREGYWVQDQYFDPTKPVRPTPDLEVPDWYYPSDKPRDYNFSLWPGERPDWARELSAGINRVIWQ